VINPDTGVHKHYGFVEYEQPHSMKEAITAMNGFDLGGQLIRVGPCVVPPSMHNLSAVRNVGTYFWEPYGGMDFLDTKHASLAKSKLRCEK